MREYYNLSPWILLFFIPALTMRVWSEEKRSGTIETLFTFPIKEKDVILGKFLVVMGIIFIALLLSILIPLSLLPAGATFDFGRIFASFIGVLLLSSAFSILGITISLTTKNQIVAFLVTIFILFILLIIGQPIFLYAIPDFLQGFFEAISLGSRYSSMTKGVISLSDFVYFGSFFALFYTIHSTLLRDRS